MHAHQKLQKSGDAQEPPPDLLDRFWSEMENIVIVVFVAAIVLGGAAIGFLEWIGARAAVLKYLFSG
jgi:hypothetical protein